MWGKPQMKSVSSHLNDKQKDLKFINIVTSGRFNKSATLDESNLIRYLSEIIILNTKWKSGRCKSQLLSKKYY